MRLALEDNGFFAKVRKIYNPKTGMIIKNNKRKKIKRIVNTMNEGFPLSGIFKNIKKKRKVRQDNKVKRVENRQTSKTNRQATKQDKRQAYREGNKQTQVNRLNRKTTRGEAQVRKINEKSDMQISKIRNKSQEKQGAENQEFDPEESDQLPENVFDVNGGNYMIDKEEQGIDNNTIDVDFENVTQEQNFQTPELSLGPLMDYFNQEQELSGWIDGVLKVAKGAVGGVVNAVAPDSKIGKTLLNVKNSKIGTTVSRAIAKNTDASQLRERNVLLNERIKNLENQRLIFSAVSAVIGAGTGYMVGKSKKS